MRPYGVVSIGNDFLIAICFCAGSILFLFPEYEQSAIWLSIIGSFRFPVRLAIRLAGRFHVRRIPGSHWNY